MVEIKIPIDGMPSLSREFAIEVGQFIGAPSPFRMLTDFRKAIYSGKISIPVAMLVDVMNLPSNCGRTIKFSSDDDKLPSPSIIKHYTRQPASVVLDSLYSQFLPAFRGWEDILQIANIPYAAISLAVEIPLKIVGAAITHGPFKLWQYANNESHATWKRGLVGTVATIVSIPLYPIGWAFSAVGNMLGYARRSLDAVVNLVSSGLSLLSGNYGKDYPTFTTSLKTLGKSIALAVGGGTIVSGLINMAIIKVRSILGISRGPTEATTPSSTAVAMKKTGGGRLSPTPSPPSNQRTRSASSESSSVHLYDWDKSHTVGSHFNHTPESSSVRPNNDPGAPAPVSRPPSPKP